MKSELYSLKTKRRKEIMKKTLLVSILLIPFMLIPIAFAGEPGPGAGPGEKLVAPTVHATLGMVTNPLGNGVLDIVILGTCKKQPFSLYIPDFFGGGYADLSLITADTIKGWRVSSFTVPEVATICNTRKPRQELMIVDVKDFINTNEQILAEVTIMFVEPVK
jgi:hypothetical protein